MVAQTQRVTSKSWPPSALTTACAVTMGLYAYLGLADLARSHMPWLPAPHAGHLALALAALFSWLHAAAMLGSLTRPAMWAAVVWITAGTAEDSGAFGTFAFDPVLRGGAVFGIPWVVLGVYWMTAWHVFVTGSVLVRRVLRARGRHGSAIAVGVMAVALMVGADLAADPCYSTISTGSLRGPTTTIGSFSPSSLLFFDAAVDGLTLRRPLPTLPTLWAWAPCETQIMAGWCVDGVPLSNMLAWAAVAAVIFTIWGALFGALHRSTTPLMSAAASPSRSSRSYGLCPSRQAAKGSSSRCTRSRRPRCVLRRCSSWCCRRHWQLVLFSSNVVNLNSVLEHMMGRWSLCIARAEVLVTLANSSVAPSWYRGWWQRPRVDHEFPSIDLISKPPPAMSTSRQRLGQAAVAPLRPETSRRRPHAAYRSERRHDPACLDQAR
jgi:hypothetical protein